MGCYSKTINEVAVIDGDDMPVYSKLLAGDRAETQAINSMLKFAKNSNFLGNFEVMIHIFSKVSS